MPKEPYIKFFYNDWIGDTRTLSAEAKGAWIDIICYMNQSKHKGVLTCDATKLQQLLGMCSASVERVLNEFEEYGTCDIVGDRDGTFQIISRRILRDIQIHEVKSRAGIASAEKRAQKKEREKNKKPTGAVTPVATEELTPASSSDEAYNNYNYNYKISNNTEIGGVGEREKKPIQKLLISTNSVLSLDDCLQAFLHHLVCKGARESAVRVNSSVFLVHSGEEQTSIDLKLLEQWGDFFNKEILGKRSVISKQLGDWTAHFINILKNTDLTQDPQKLLQNGNKSHSNKTAGGGKKTNSSGNPSIDKLQASKSSSGNNGQQPPVGGTVVEVNGSGAS